MHRVGCQRKDHPAIGRRELLQVGGLSLLGTGLTDLLQLESQAAESSRPGRAKAVVFIFQSGGPSQHETFDPKPNGKNASGEVFMPGRHHWGDVFPCFFAGGGIQPGHVIGTTDPHGGVPTSDAYTPSDLAATIFHLLGVGPDREFHDAAGRPYRIYRGQPIRALL